MCRMFQPGETIFVLSGGCALHVSALSLPQVKSAVPSRSFNWHCGFGNKLTG